MPFKTAAVRVPERAPPSGPEAMVHGHGRVVVDSDVVELIEELDSDGGSNLDAGDDIRGILQEDHVRCGRRRDGDDAGDKLVDSIIRGNEFVGAGGVQGKVVEGGDTLTTSTVVVPRSVAPFGPLKMDRVMVELSLVSVWPVES